MAGEPIELKVRCAVDDTELTALHRLAFNSERPAGSEAVHPWASRLRRHSLVWIGAFSAGRMIGFVYAVWDGGNHAFVLDTVVHPEFRRNGIGRELVRAVASEAFAAGCEWVHVDYDSALVDFYEKACGFRPTPAGLLSVSD